MSPGPGSLDSPVIRFGKATAWALLWALVLVLFIRMMGTVALIDPDEGRNAEVAREMAESGDFVVPHLNGLPYLDKPVLLFAASALSIHAFGADELAARLPPLLFTLATVGMVVAFGWRRFGRETGLVAGMLLASSPIVLAYSGIVIFDAPMMFWVSCAAIAFHLSLERGQRGYCLAAWGTIGFATLTKGPVGILLPLLIGVGDALLTRRPPSRLFCLSGFGVFLLLVGPWFLAVSLRYPEFPHYAFVRETVERVATDNMRRTGPIYYFVPILLAGAFPWVSLLPAGARTLAGFWRERMKSASTEMFLILWALLPTLFFSISQSKRPGYILPVIPALSLLAARVLQKSPDTLRILIWISAPVSAGVGAALLLTPDALASLIRSAPGIAVAFRNVAPYLGAGLIATSGLTMLGLLWRGAALAGLVLTPLVLVLGSQGVLMALGEQRSAREMAQAIHEATDGQARVIGVSAYPASLSYYLRTKVLLATPRVTEIRSNYITDYGYALRDAPASTLRPFGWWYAELQSCPATSVFVLGTRKSWDRERTALANRLPLIYRNHLYEAYGPCGAETP